MKNLIHGCLRLPNLGLLLLGLAACSNLTVEVDVYRGPLANHEDVQLEQAIVMAVASKPILIEFRDRLEQAERQRRGESSDWTESDWYQRKFISAPEGGEASASADSAGCNCGLDDHREPRKISSHLAPRAVCAECASQAYLVSSQAIAINEILGLFEEPQSGSARLSRLSEEAEYHAIEASKAWDRFCQRGDEETVGKLKGLSTGTDSTARAVRAAIVGLLDDQTGGRNPWRKKQHAFALLTAGFTSLPVACELESLGVSEWDVDRSRIEFELDHGNTAEAESVRAHWERGLRRWLGGGAEDEDSTRLQNSSKAEQDEKNPQYRFRSTWVFSALADKDTVKTLVDRGLEGAPQRLSRRTRDSLIDDVVRVAKGFDDSRLQLGELLDVSIQAQIEILGLEAIDEAQDVQRAYAKVLDGTLQLIDEERLAVAVKSTESNLIRRLDALDPAAELGKKVSQLSELPEQEPPSPLGTGNRSGAADWSALRRQVVETILFGPESRRRDASVLDTDVDSWDRCAPQIDVCLTSAAISELAQIKREFSSNLREGRVGLAQQQLYGNGGGVEPSLSGPVSAFSRASQAVAGTTPLTRIGGQDSSLVKLLAEGVFQSAAGLMGISKSILRPSSNDPGLDARIAAFLDMRAAIDKAAADGSLPDEGTGYESVGDKRTGLMRSLVRFSEKLRVHSVLSLAMGDSVLASEDDRQTALLLEAVGQMLQFQLDELNHLVDHREESVSRAGAVFSSYQDALRGLYGETDPSPAGVPPKGQGGYKNKARKLGESESDQEPPEVPDPLNDWYRYTSDYDVQSSIDLESILDTVQDAIVSRKAALAIRKGTNRSDESREELAARIAALDEAIEITAGHRRDQAFLRPAFAYLRQSFFASDLQTRAGEASSLSKRSLQEISQLLDKRFWININTVRVDGYGKSGSVLVKDDVGNWYVKSTSSDPEELFDTMKSAAMLQLDAVVSAERAAEIARTVTEPTGSEAGGGDDDNGQPEAASSPTSREGLVLDSVIDKADSELSEATKALAIEVRKIDDDLKARWSMDWADVQAISKAKGAPEVLAEFLLSGFEETVPMELEAREQPSGGAPRATDGRRWIQQGEAYLKSARDRIVPGEDLEGRLLALRESAFKDVLENWVLAVKQADLVKARKDVLDAYSSLESSLNGSPLKAESGGKLPQLPAAYHATGGGGGRWAAAQNKQEESKLLQLDDAGSVGQWITFAQDAADLLALRGTVDTWTSTGGGWDKWKTTHGQYVPPAGSTKPDDAEVTQLDDALVALKGAVDGAFGAQDAQALLAMTESAKTAAEHLHAIYGVLAPSGSTPNSSLADLVKAVEDSDKKVMGPLAARAIQALQAYRERLDFGMELVE